nr:MAG: putative coat protein [Tombusviridae sp.]
MSKRVRIEETIVPIRKKTKRSARVNKQRSSSEFVLPPVATGGIFTRRVTPRLSTVGDRTLVYNCEVVNNFTTNALGTFNTTRIPLHTAQPLWLAGVADNFSKYRWIAMRAIYIPSGPTINPGTFVFNLGYDYGDNAPASLNAAQSNYKAVSAPLWGGYGGSELLSVSLSTKPPSNSVVLDVDVTRFPLVWYPVVSTQAIFNAFTAAVKNTYSPCYIDASSSGGPATPLQSGQVFLHYIVELIEPIQTAQNV